jgi:hypothetical protein
VIAALLAAVALAGPADQDRYRPVPPATLTLAHAKLGLKQGGQRVHVTIPMSPGVDAYGDTVTYRWDTSGSGGRRCRPGALPGLAAVSAGTVIDAPLPMPPGGWCRGDYGVTLQAVIAREDGQKTTESVASAGFQAGRPARTVCHRRGEVDRCWTAPSRRDKGGWLVTAPLDDLLGPDGATMDADPYFDRAFRGHPVLQDNWETDDDTFYGFPPARAQAARMAAIVDRVLRAGPFHAR